MEDHFKAGFREYTISQGYDGKCQKQPNGLYYNLEVQVPHKCKDEVYCKSKETLIPDLEFRDYNEGARYARKMIESLEMDLLHIIRCPFLIRMYLLGE